MSNKQSHLQRIQRIMNFYLKRGVNKERINEIYKKIINNKFNGRNCN